MVVVVGETVTVVPLSPPGFHEYVVAPEPVRSAEPPVQIVEGVADAETESDELTVTVTVAVPVQDPVVPVTV